MINFKQEFVERITSILGDDADKYFDALEQPPVKGFHINTTKCQPDTVLQLGFGESISGVANGVRVVGDQRPTKHPYYSAGLYYMQEPSAMLPVSALELPDNAKVLDMCSAPGGKSSQLAIKLQGNGLLVSNEADRSRAQILRENIVRMGYTNTVVTSMDTTKLANTFGGFFDVVVVDAPCSGEGMLRKEQQAVLDWSTANIRACATRQREIITQADKCLRQGGTLLYCTCTFAPEEDEDMADFIISLGYKVATVNSALVSNAVCARHGYKFFPHRFCGEGQYFCVFTKDSSAQPATVFGAKQSLPNVDKKFLQQLSQFVDTYGLDVRRKGDMLFVPALPYDIACYNNGVLLATVEKDGRLTPAHQLFSALGGRCITKVSFDNSDSRIERYLNGQEVSVTQQDFACDSETLPKGWCCVMVDGYPLGGAKLVGTRLKNHYPKHLRTR